MQTHFPNKHQINCWIPPKLTIWCNLLGSFEFWTQNEFDYELELIGNELDYTWIAVNCTELKYSLDLTVWYLTS